VTGPASQPELLAPAGDFDALRAAVANGADAVYFGLSAFNARRRAANFTLEELPKVLDYLHGHNVRGYVALNTLIFSDELPRVAEFVCCIARAGADAVIVQDLGLAQLIQRLAPGLPIHGSTQMTLTEPRGIEFVRRLGVSRVILARELALADIRRLAAETDMPLEVFVHGALCVAYSGQCLTSESLGGRSANRGQCAQACRLPYQLIVDGSPRDLGDQAYLLSPRDLAAYDLVGELAQLGVAGLKIEGRLKSAHYVAATTQTYRAAIDDAATGRPFAPSATQLQDLTQTFSRGFSPGFLRGTDHQTLIHGRFPKSRGVRLGTVAGTTARSVLLELERESSARHPGAGSTPPLRPGDGVVFDQGHPEQWEQGGRVFSVTPAPARTAGIPGIPGTGPLLELTFGHGAVQLAAIAAGSIVWKTDDPALRRRLEQSYARDIVARPEVLTLRIDARAGAPLTITARDGAGHEARVQWAGPLAPAQKHPLTLDLIRAQWSRLGQTPFTLGDIELTGIGPAPDSQPVMVPKSVLNDLRRQAVEALLAQRARQSPATVTNPDALADLRRAAAGLAAADRGAPRDSAAGLCVLVRNQAQLDAVLAWRPPPAATPAVRLAMVYADFEDLHRYRPAVAQARAAGVPIGLATLRVLQVGQEGYLQLIADCQPDAVLVRNLAAIGFFAQRPNPVPLIGDYALNVTNELTAALLLGAGLRRLTPGYDLNYTQLAAMLQRIDPAFFEVVVHQHMPMFHMEHCVFAHTLSTGKDYRTCGRPCDHHSLDLRDRVGASHPLVPDAGCRNTLFNAQAQSAAEWVPQMLRGGVCHFRVELLRHSAAQSVELLDRYARVLAGLDDGPTAWRSLRALPQLGVTRGSFEPD
jgi:putative protease